MTLAPSVRAEVHHPRWNPTDPLDIVAAAPFCVRPCREKARLAVDRE